jgi:hypothetical protein
MASNPDPENWHMQRREKVPSLAMPAFLRRCVVAPTSLVPIWHAKMLNGTSGNLGRLVLQLVDTVSHGGVEWSNERRIGVVNLLLAIPSKLLYAHPIKNVPRPWTAKWVIGKIGAAVRVLATAPKGGSDQSKPMQEARVLHAKTKRCRLPRAIQVKMLQAVPSWAWQSIACSQIGQIGVHAQ